MSFSDFLDWWSDSFGHFAKPLGIVARMAAAAVILCGFGLIGRRVGAKKGRAQEGFWLGFFLGWFGLIIIAAMGPSAELQARRHADQAWALLTLTQAYPNLPPTGLGAQLQGSAFDGKRLSGADFSGANLAGASFVKADLRSARFVAANLRGADLSEARLSHASLDGADLEGANFTAADLTAASMWGANLSGAVLVYAAALQLDMTGAILRNTHMPDGSIKP